MKNFKYIIAAVLIVIIAVFGFAIVNDLKKNDDTTIVDGGSTTSDNEKDTTQEPTTEPETDAPVEVSLMAVGDNLIHMGIVTSGKKTDGSYNFDFLYTGIKKYIDEADISVINQETIFGGNNLGFSGYPKFNSPTEVGDAVVKAGFNVVLQASNHTKDQGITGVQNAIAYWKQQQGVTVLGVHDSQESQDTITYMDVKGVKIAMLNYTYGLNGGTLKNADSFRIDLLGQVDPATNAISTTEISSKLISQIKEADANADFVIVFPHWGTEYRNTPTETQQLWAKQMTEAGCDLIIGAHPHVIETIEWIQADNGNKSLCYYSLGNYVSTQNDAAGMLGGIAIVKLVKENGKTSIKTDGTGIIPIVTHYKYTGGNAIVEGVCKLSDYTEEKAATHGIIKRAGIKFSKAILQNIVDKYIADWVLE